MFKLNSTNRLDLPLNLLVIELILLFPYFLEVIMPFSVPFREAAELGTKKVITDHSTIGMVVTTDGSVTELPRENYEEAEERVVAELQELGKPFLILLNTAAPYSDSTESLRSELEKKYGVPVLAVNAAQLKAEDIRRILERVLKFRSLELWESLRQRLGL